MCPVQMAHECEDDVLEDSLSGCSSDSNIVSKQNSKAFIWKCLGFELNEKGNPQSKNHPKCCLSWLEITVKMETLQIYIYSHLMNKHPEEWDIVQKAAANTSRKQQRDETQ